MRLLRLYRDVCGLAYDIDGWRPQLVPDAFQSDNITCPSWLKRLLGLGRYEACGRFHDWLYAGGIPTRSQADSLFRQALILHGCPPRTAWCAWAAVRIFGQRHWTK